MKLKILRQSIQITLTSGVINRQHWHSLWTPTSDIPNLLFHNGIRTN